MAFCALLAAGLLTGCGSNNGIQLVGGSGTSLSGVVRTYQRGYVMSEGALDQVPVGSSQEQVLLVLGTPSTVATVNGDVFYYISQTQQKVAFLKPEITEQKVLAIYFGKDRRVTRIANYGLQDGKIFDFVTQTTPTSGEELIAQGKQFTEKTGKPYLIQIMANETASYTRILYTLLQQQNADFFADPTSIKLNTPEAKAAVELMKATKE